jgi:cytochrome c oxidase cbb3-type subunit I
MLGGLLYLSGALIMAYNLWMTVRSQALAESASAAQPAFAPAAAE